MELDFDEGFLHLGGEMLIQDSNSTVEKEIRFAVVMYGGVSLAIYINGVAQELYKLVRATARKINEDGSPGPYVVEDPDETELVYRQLGAHLQARFVIDILSGTSAGGINAVFLAKALANHQSMANLENLWVTEGDIQRLINDEMSLAEIDGLQITQPPASLLNSDRMYYRLLEALDKMDTENPGNEESTSPFVEELDLFITATDIRGLRVPISLADREVHEYRYRTVFRFLYSTEESSGSRSQDFLRRNNPFLAFAARATSSFPFAFQPIKLGDVQPILGIQAFMDNYKYDELKGNWANFHREYRSDTDNFYLHSFGDGGYLDNKPFSYISETLSRRRADLPVDRRLFYIEPAPESRQDKPIPDNDRPDPVENVLAATLTLPRYETIREDLLQIKARNDLIERSSNILRQIERVRGDFEKQNFWISSKKDWPQKYLDELLPIEQAGYAAYHQLRMAETLDDFAAAVARNIGIEENTRTFTALRQIIDRWRFRKYSTSAADRGMRTTENDILFRMDLGWRLRRLQFLLGLIDAISLGLKGLYKDAKLEDEAQQYARELVTKSRNAWRITTPEEEQQYREALSWIKRRLNNAYVLLRGRVRKLRARGLATRPIEQLDPELAEYAREVRRLQWLNPQVEGILKNQEDIGNVCEDIEKLFRMLTVKPEEGTQTPTGYLYKTLHLVSREFDGIFAARHIREPAPKSEARSSRVPDRALRNVQACLRFYFDYYEYYDVLTFPIRYATSIGESDLMDVYRISPADATGLFKETAAKPKLAGTRLGNFGAFFKKEWRENDILWGRLDGAERIISTLIPDSEMRTELLVRAWLAILKEKQDRLGEDNRRRLEERLGAYWNDIPKPGSLSPAELQGLHQKLTMYFKDDYDPDMTLSPEEMLGAFKRSVAVTSALFAGIAQRSGGSSTVSALVAKIGRRFANLLEYAIPGTRGNTTLQRWIRISYLVDGFLIVTGSCAFWSGMFWLGVIGLALSLGIDLGVRSFGKRLLGLFHYKRA